MFLDTSQVQFLDFRSNIKILLLQFQVSFKTKRFKICEIHSMNSLETFSL